MEQSVHIAALDLGTSQIKAMVARKTEDGMLSILASEQIDSENCIRRGYVFNMEETTNKVSQLIARLNKKLDSPIEKIYVGVSGQSIHIEPHSITKEVPGGVVTQDLLDAITEEARDFELDSFETLDVVSPEYYLDGQLESNPKGATCSVIEARFNLIVGRSTLKGKLIPVIRKAKQEVAKFLISPLATAEAVLTEREKELGCALVEFGAGVTSVFVYKGGLLRYLVTIPLGGDVITKDIRSLDILKSEAEAAKRHFSETEGNDRIKEAIEARRDEILKNVIRQIEESGQSLSAGIIITGGGALLKELPEALREKSGKEVRLANAEKKIIRSAGDWGQNPENSCVIGLLSLGTEECLKEQEIAISGPGELFSIDEVPIVKGEGKKGGRRPPKGNNIFSEFGRNIGKKLETFSDTLFPTDIDPED
jgi:Actin-like ATPase involved in cell division